MKILLFVFPLHLKALTLLYILFLEFEWSWDSDNKSAACDLSEDCRLAMFHKNYSSGTAAVRGNVPMTDKQYFYEIKMISPVYGTDMVSFSIHSFNYPVSNCFVLT